MVDVKSFRGTANIRGVMNSRGCEGGRSEKLF